MAEPIADPSVFLVADRISANPEICGGRPCIAGTRMRVTDIVGMIAEGATVDEILAEFDYVSREDIQAALRFAAHASEQKAGVAA